MTDVCIALTGSNSCDMYSNQALDLTRLAADSARNKNSTGISYGSDSIKDVTTFDAWVNSSARDITGYFYTSFSNPNCSGVTPSSVTFRYLSTLLCVQTVLFDSTPLAATPNVNGCAQNVQNPTPTMCSDVCSAFASSYLGVLSNTSFCKFSNSYINQATANYNALCKAMSDGTYASPTANCTSGNTWDATSCGYGLDKLDQARAYCKTSAGQADSCCKRVSTGAIVTPTASSSPSASSTPVDSGSSSNPALIGGIAGAILVLVIVAVASVFIFIRKQKKDAKKKEEDAARRQLDRLEAAVSEQSKAAVVAAAAAAAAATVTNHNTSSTGSENVVVESGASFNETTFGAVWKVITAYEPQIDDEVRLEIGHEVALETVYNDGWARGVNRSTGDAGYLPMACLAPASSAAATGNSPSSPNLTHVLTMTNQPRTFSASVGGGGTAYPFSALSGPTVISGVPVGQTIYVAPSIAGSVPHSSSTITSFSNPLGGVIGASAASSEAGGHNPSLSFTQSNTVSSRLNVVPLVGNGTVVSASQSSTISGSGSEDGGPDRASSPTSPSSDGRSGAKDYARGSFVVASSDSFDSPLDGLSR
ncbi:hypothetical protein DFJ73DRAFT_792627 [Zopfochytrium polystomum]|nr:hypothetical protein DFJ73DRAFT_792627 [Zopfochytrium polystomum]